MAERLVFDLLANDHASAGFLTAGRAASAAADDVRGLSRRLDEISGRSATARVALAGDKDALARLDQLDVKLLAVGNRRASPNITLQGALKANLEIAGISAALDKLNTQVAAPVSTGGGGSILGILRLLSSTHVTLFGGGLGGLSLPAILGTVSGLHLLVEGITETTAVVLPAAIAFTVFGVAAIPAVTTLAGQMGNLLTVSAATGKTIPPLTGGFSAMAAAVQPQVYVLFGEGLDMINSKAGVLQKLALGAGSAMDALASRSVVALQGGGAGGILASGAADLMQIGTFFGNMFGTIGNILKVLPGYAQDLLGILVSVSHGVEDFTSAGFVQEVLKVGLAAHGLVLYTGLAATAASKILAPALSGAADLATGAGIRLLGLGRAGGIAGEALGALGGVLNVASKLPWGWIAVGAAAVAILTIRFLSSKSAAQQWVASLQDSINTQQSFTQVISATQLVIGKLDVAQAGATSSMKILTDGSTNFGASQQSISQNLGKQAEVLSATTAGHKQYSAELDLERSRVTQLSDQFGSVAGAQAAWNAIHLKSADISTISAAAWKADVQQLAAYQLAVKAVASAMGQSGSEQYNAALNALNNTFLTGTLPDIQKVTAAEAALMNVVLGGRQGFIGFQQDIQQMGTDAKTASDGVDGLSAAGLTLGNDFYTTSVPAAEKLLGALQQQQIALPQLTTAVGDTASQLLPFAGHSADARATVVSLINDALGPGTVSLKTLNTWVRNNSGSLGGFNSIIAQSTIHAGGLAGVLETDLDTQFHALLLKTSGADAQLRIWTSDIVHGTTQTAAGQSTRARLIADLESTGMTAQQATTYVDGLQKKIDAMHGKAVSVTAHASASGSVVFLGKVPGTATIQGRMLVSSAGMRVPGYGGGDVVPALVEPGETIVPKHITPEIAPIMKAHGIRGFASGALVGSLGSMSGFAGQGMASFEDAAMGAFLSAGAGAVKTALTAALAGGARGPGPGNLPLGSGPLSGSAAAAQSFAQSILWAYGWGMSQWPPLDALWNRESGWNAYAVNSSSGAMGIPQSLGHGTPFRLGDYQAQDRWGLAYISGRYGSPAAAWQHEQEFGWYGGGLDAIYSRPTVIGVGDRGPEHVQVTPVGAPAVRSGPLVTFGDVHVSERADVSILAQQLSWAVTTAGLG